MDPATFLTELKRRKVYRVAVAYAIAAWLLIQAASILFPTFEAPPWVMKVFVTAVILGFPVALILAWAFELTPEGLRRSEEVAPRESKMRKLGSKWTALIVIAAVLAAALLAFQFARTRRSLAIEPPKQTALTATLDKSVAVLPFENLSSDKENAFFAQGVQDEIITTLSKISGLRVISRTSTARYNSAPENLPEVAITRPALTICSRTSGQRRIFTSRRSRSTQGLLLLTHASRSRLAPSTISISQQSHGNRRRMRKRSSRCGCSRISAKVISRLD